MVADRTTDGVRIAQLLASELTGDGGSLARVRVSDAEPDAEPMPQGTLAYRVRLGGPLYDDPDESSGGDGAEQLLADVYVHPDRVRVEFAVAPDAVAAAAEDAQLRVRPKEVTPPQTVVFVEDGAQVKRVLPSFEAAAAAAAA